MGKKVLAAYFYARGRTALSVKNLMAGKLLNGASGTEMKTWAESIL